AERGVCLATAVDHEYASRRAGFECLARGMRAALEDFHLIEVFARRNVAQGKRLSHHDRAGARDAAHAAHRDVAQPELEEDGGERRAARLPELVEGLLRYIAHSFPLPSLVEKSCGASGTLHCESMLTPPKRTTNLVAPTPSMMSAPRAVCMQRSACAERRKTSASTPGCDARPVFANRLPSASCSDARRAVRVLPSLHGD